MGTPVSPIPGPIPPLYGDCAIRINHSCATIGKAAVEQWFEFEGRIADKGVNWLRKKAIHQDGKPWFTLMLDSFAVELA